MSKIVENTKSHKSEIIYHIIGWVIVFGNPLFTINTNEGIDWGTLLKQFIMPICLFVIFYCNYFYLVPRLYISGKRHIFYAINVVLITGCTLFNVNMFKYMMRLERRQQMRIEKAEAAQGNKNTKPKKHWKPMPALFFHARDVLTFSFPIGLTVAIFTNRRLKKSEQERKEAELRQKEAELRNLRSQINPHFLLNTLNNIYALIAFNTGKAQTSVLELSRLLRHVLYDNQQEYTTVSKELEFLESYVELMKIRVASNISVNFKSEVSDSQRLIAPLIFISLIENAFKHGISPIESSFINIHITDNNNSITCCVTNTNFPKNNHTDKSGSGIGLEQIRKRLELTYPGKYTWEKGVSDDNKTYYSRITINTL